MTKDLSVTDIVATLEQAMLCQKCNQDHSPGPCKVKVEPEENLKTEISDLARRIIRNADIDVFNCFLHQANAINAMLGKSKRYEFVPYPTDAH